MQGHILGKIAEGKSAPHECVEHNQNKNERDLLRSMFGASPRNPSELLIGKTYVGATSASARSTVNLATALGESKHKQPSRLSYGHLCLYVKVNGKLNNSGKPTFACIPSTGL